MHAPGTNRCARSAAPVLVVVLAVVVAMLAPSPANAQTSCESLTLLALPATITAATLDRGGYCRVRGEFPPSDHFEVWLPTAGWNGKFMGVGNLGNAGYVDTNVRLPAAPARDQ